MAGEVGMRAPPACVRIDRGGLGPSCRPAGHGLAYRVCDERWGAVPAAPGSSVDC